MMGMAAYRLLSTDHSPRDHIALGAPVLEVLLAEDRHQAEGSKGTFSENELNGAGAARGPKRAPEQLRVGSDFDFA